MGEIVNLNRARKAKARADKAAQSDANRAKFGRTKAKKAADASDAARHHAAVDSAKLED